MPSLQVAETDFALNLLKQTPIESAVFSPLSIAIALSVVYTGARGKTKSEIGDAILNGANASQLEAHFGSLAYAALNVNETTVDIATRVFIAQGFPISAAYFHYIQDAYKVDAVNLNFFEKVKAAETVNGFVNNATSGKISKLVSADSFNNAVALLVNAIYFKAEWETQFSRSSKEQFYSDMNTTHEVDMMHLSVHLHDEVFFPYAENHRLRVVKIPYKHKDFEFAIFLPVARFGLRNIHGSITGTELQELLANVKKTPLNLKVPKFHVETALKLTEILNKLGINLAFSNEADFSLITPQRIKVTDAIHKAVITVDQPFLYAVLYKNRPFFLGQYF